MKIVIISGGNIQSDFALSFLKKYNPHIIIGVDRGLEFCETHNVLPDYILGDFDSVKKETLERFQKANIPIEKYPCEKDDTDTELAIKKAMELKAHEIYILGGTGTRLDHVQGNLQILYRTIKEGITCYLLDANNKITILLPGTTLVPKNQVFGKYISFLPFTDEVKELTLEGFAYPLASYTMTKLNSLGVSNQLSSTQGEVTFTQGALLMIQSRD